MLINLILTVLKPCGGGVMVIAALVFLGAAVGIACRLIKLLAGTAEDNFKIGGGILKRGNAKADFGIFDYKGFKVFAIFKRSATNGVDAFWENYTANRRRAEAGGA